MTSTARLKNRNGDLTWPARIGLTGLLLGIADRVGKSPQLVYMLGGAAFLGVLAAVPTDVFFGLVLLLRDLSDDFANTRLAAGLNGGALIGVLAIVAGGLRMMGKTDFRGLGALLFLLLLSVMWTIVGFLNFGINGSIAREFVRFTSILVVAAVAAVSVRHLSGIDRIVAIVVLVTVLEAIIALVVWVQSRDLHLRVRGTFDHPNTAAAAFGVALALSFWKLLERRSRRYAFAATILAIGMLGTRSLGGLAQLLATLLAYTLLAHGEARRRAAKALAFGIIVVGVFSLTPLGQDRVKQIQTTRSFSAAAQGNQSNSLDWRFGNWSRLLTVWRVHPFFGFGSGATTKLVQPGGSIPHSDALRFLVETGVVGLSVFATTFLALLVALYRRARAPAESASYATVMLAIVLGLTVHGLVNNITLETTVMYMLAVLLGGLFGVAAYVPRRISGIPSPAVDAA